MSLSVQSKKIDHFDISWFGPQKMINGYGQIREGSSVIFEGHFIQNDRNGFGIEYGRSNSIIYKGQFQNGDYSGWGSTPIYQGQFQQNMYNGFGKLSTDEEVYFGFFRDGLYDGQGIRFMANRSQDDQEKLKIPRDPSKMPSPDISKEHSKQFSLLKQGQEGPSLPYGGNLSRKKLKLGVQQAENIIQFMTQLLDSNMEKMEKYGIAELYIGEWSAGVYSGNGKIWKGKDYWYAGQFSHGLFHGKGTLKQPLKGAQTGFFTRGKLDQK